MCSAGMNNLIVILVILNIIGLGIISFWVWRNQQFFNKLFPEYKGDLKEKLAEVINELTDLRILKEINKNNIQKIVLKRYNPYQDTGGNQSFSVALLDGNNDGVVLTSLHSRAGTRIFGKSVKTGKEDQTEFSQEEKEVIAKALMTN